MKKILCLSIQWLATMVVVILMSQACTRHEVDVKPVEIKPIHITIDVNVKIDRELDEFFDDIDSAGQTETETSDHATE